MNCCTTGALAQEPRRRLTGRQIGLMRYLACASGLVRLPEDARAMLIPLWRRGLINCLYLQVPDEGMRGPYFQLTSVGRQLALMFVRAERARRIGGSPSLPSPARATARAS